MEKNTDEGRTKFNTDVGQHEEMHQKPGETVSSANFPKKSDQGGKFSPQGKEDQGDWQNAPSEGKPGTSGRTSEDSRVKGPADGQERSGGTSK